jgi:hypothetical protein
VYLLVCREKGLTIVAVEIATAERRLEGRCALAPNVIRMSPALLRRKAVPRKTGRPQSMRPSANRNAQPSGLFTFRWNTPVKTFDRLDVDQARSDVGRLACAQSLCRSQDHAGPTAGMYSTDQGEMR